MINCSINTLFKILQGLGHNGHQLSIPLFPFPLLSQGIILRYMLNYAGSHKVSWTQIDTTEHALTIFSILLRKGLHYLMDFLSFLSLTQQETT